MQTDYLSKIAAILLLGSNFQAPFKEPLLGAASAELKTTPELLLITHPSLQKYIFHGVGGYSYL